MEIPLSLLRRAAPICRLALMFACVDMTAASDAAASEENATRTVILLTGFEPFGQDRSANSSWEGIRDLQGREVQGYQLECRQIPVEWGAPGKLLPEWIEELQPAAVLAFGQGIDFAIESRARNQRGAIKDNLEQLPPHAWIVEGGAEEVLATADYAQLFERMAARGHRLGVSSDAGGYLCQEALYTLETLKNSKFPGTAVLFSHVPPLKRVGGDRGKIERYALDLVDCWLAAYQQPAPGPAKTEDTATKQVRELIKLYFSSWSEQRMDVYGSLFLPEAAIQQLDPDGTVVTAKTKEFVAAQKAYQSRRPAKEVPVKIDIKFEQALARVVVYWKLDADGVTKYGYDHFTLVRAGQEWRILNLAFYESRKPPAQ